MLFSLRVIWSLFALLLDNQINMIFLRLYWLCNHQSVIIRLVKAIKMFSNSHINKPLSMSFAFKKNPN